jgi:copper chaperone CopZ
MLNRFKLAFVTSALALALGVGSAAACPGNASEKSAKADAKSATPVPASAVTASFRVVGMHCAECKSHVEEALNKLNGIYKVDVKMADKRVTVAFDKSKVTPEAITKAMNDAGFQASAEV